MSDLSTEYLNPIYMINDYLWALLQQELGWTKAGGLIPIATFDAPELREANKAYIIYSFNEESKPNISPFHSFTGTFVVFSPTAKQTNQTVQLLSMALSDERASQNILDWASNPVNTKTFYNKINLGYVDVMGSQGAMPPVEEGGLTDGYIQIRYRYTAQDKDFSIRA